MVQVIRERPSQRQHHRVDAPLYVEIGKNHYKVEDWSLGGLRVTRFKGSLPKAKQSLHLPLTLPFQGFNISFDVEGKVLRADKKDKTVVISFVNLGEREKNLMKHFLDELIRGSMSTLNDTIQRIDTPVTLVPTEPSANPETKIPIKRWPVKSILTTLVYLFLGGFIALYLAIFLYSQFYRLEVTSAVISAPVEVVSAVGDGRIISSTIEEGERVKAGDPVIITNVFELENQKATAVRLVREAQAEAAFWLSRLNEARARLDDLGMISQSNILRTQMELMAANVQLAAAQEEEGRISELLNGGWATQAEFERASAHSKSLEQARDIIQLKLIDFQRMAVKNDGVRYYDGREYQVNLQDILASYMRAYEAVGIAQQHVHDIEVQIFNLAVIAPFDGIAIEIAKTAGSAINAGDVIATFENDSKRIVEAWLNQEEVLEVGLGDIANVYSPTLDVHFEARVVKVDRTTSFVDEMQSRYMWRGPDDRTALVELEYSGRDENFITLLNSGVPVVVYFKRRTVNGIWASLFGSTEG